MAPLHGDVARVAQAAASPFGREARETGDAGERVAHAFVVPRERDVRSNRHEQQCGAVRERQASEKARGGTGDLVHAPGLERALIHDEHDQPADAGALVRADGIRIRAAFARSAGGAVDVSTYSTDTRRLGLPATVMMKSVSPRPRTGCPCRSTTPTSIVTSSVPVRNVGGCVAVVGRRRAAAWGPAWGLRRPVSCVAVPCCASNTGLAMRNRAVSSMSSVRRVCMTISPRAIQGCDIPDGRGCRTGPSGCEP